MFHRARKTEASPADRFPVLTEENESSEEGLYLVGDITGMPLLKNALNQGYEIIERLAKKLENETVDAAYEVVIVGGGAAGLSAALRAEQRGLRYLVLEKARVANTLRNFPAGKMIHAEPVELETRGDLWLGQAPKEEFLRRWEETIRSADLAIRENAEVTDVTRTDAGFQVTTKTGETFSTRYVVLAIGKQGEPRRLNVPGEDLPKVFSRLYDPDSFHQQDILVVGGGDSAVEAALALSERNRVTLSYRGSEFTRPKPENRRRLNAAVAAGELSVALDSTVKAINPDTVVLEAAGTEKVLPNEVVFTLLGARLPVAFFRKIGLRLENEWDRSRWVKFALWSAFVMALYYVKKFNPHHPFLCTCPLHASNDGLVAVASEWWTKTNRAAHFWYPALYSAVVCGFGLHLILRRKPSRYTFWRTLACMGFQTILFFLLPWLLKEDNVYRLGYAWPLSMGAVFKPGRARWLSPEFWWVYGLVFAFVVIPLLTYFHGKRYCSWLCGCGAMAETAGDPFRRLAPKGARAERWERMIYVVLAVAVGITLIRAFHGPKEAGRWYDLIVMWSLSGWVAISAYPFFGGRVWCRYWCPLAAYMNLVGKIASRWQIGAHKGKCIDCGLCNMNCEMGIDIRKRALRGQPVTLRDTPCVGCGECVRVCPMDCLYVGREAAGATWTLPHNEEILGIQ